MLKPSILKKILGDVFDPEVVKTEFDRVIDSDALFCAVSVDGNEKGCVIFKREGRKLEMHLCLATWFTHTRTVVALAIGAVSGLADVILAKYESHRRAVDVLLDDLGFSPGNTSAGWRTRELNLNPT